MSDVNKSNRPLSPHLSIYRNQINMVTSILNRITGAALIVSLVMVVWWLLAASTGGGYFETVTAVMTHPLALLIWAGSIWAFWFHFLGGIRHLIMDFGYGYALSTVNRSGWAIVIGSVVLTAATICCLFW